MNRPYNHRIYKARAPALDLLHGPLTELQAQARYLSGTPNGCLPLLPSGPDGFGQYPIAKDPTVNAGKSGADTRSVEPQAGIRPR